MNIPVKEPEVRYEKMAGEDCEVLSHPAYAQIYAGRVSGRATLYGSDYTHQNFIRLRISGSTLTRRISNDYSFASIDELIEVDLTEADWATFVSSLNVGRGTQCTLRRFNGEVIPQLPDPKGRADQFAAEMAATVQRSLESLNALRASVQGLKISEKAKAALLSEIEGVNQNLTSNTHFVAKQFDEHMERTVGRAKAEVHGYMNATLAQAGLKALQGPGLSYGEGASERPQIADSHDLASDSHGQ